MISKEEVKHIAKLVRLGLAETEIKKFQKELSSILDYIEKLDKVDVRNIETTSHPFQAENVVRKDKGRGRDAKARKKLIDLTPEEKEDYLKVKSVL